MGEQAKAGDLEGVDEISSQGTDEKASGHTEIGFHFQAHRQVSTNLRLGREEFSPILPFDPNMNSSLIKDVKTSVSRFTHWLDLFGETSHDHQSYFASDLGRKAKALYYQKPLLG